MNRKTYTVEEAYTGRDGIHRVYVKDHALPLTTDELLAPGRAVTIHGNHAKPYINTKDQ